MTINAHQRGILNVFAFAFLCVGFFIFHIWLRTLTVTKGFEVGDGRRELRNLEAQLANLKVEKNRQMGPERLESLARDFKARGATFEAPRPPQIFYAKPEDLERIKHH